MISPLLNLIGSIFAWFLGKFGKKILISNAYLGVAVVSWSLYLVSLGFGIYFVFALINLIQMAFTLFGSLGSTSGCVGSAVSSALSCSGFVQGFNSAQPYLSNAIVFTIMVFVHNALQGMRTKLTNYLYKYLSLTA
jgi:hypothetical protein